MWEVLIGAVAALAGGFGGAWLQARNGRQLLAAQLQDAEKARHEAYEREDRARFLDLRRKAYSELLSRWDDLKVAEEIVIESRVGLQQAEESAPAEGRLLADIVAAKQRFYDDRQEALELRAIVREATEAVLLLAPKHITDQMPDYRFPDFEEQRRRFFESARRDLGVSI